MQAIISKLQELGLKKLYSNMANIALTCTVKGILSMSFVPISRLEEAFQIVENYAAQVHDNLKEPKEQQSPN